GSRSLAGGRCRCRVFRVAGRSADDGQARRAPAPQAPELRARGGLHASISLPHCAYPAQKRVRFHRECSARKRDPALAHRQSDREGHAPPRARLSADARRDAGARRQRLAKQSRRFPGTARFQLSPEPRSGALLQGWTTDLAEVSAVLGGEPRGPVMGHAAAYYRNHGAAVPDGPASVSLARALAHLPLVCPPEGNRAAARAEPASPLPETDVGAAGRHRALGESHPYPARLFGEPLQLPPAHRPGPRASAPRAARRLSRERLRIDTNTSRDASLRYRAHAAV